MVEWFSEKLNRFGNLAEAEPREEILTDIKIKFASLTSSESAVVAKNLDLSNLFNQLTSNDSSDDEAVEQTCQALQIVSEAAEPGHVLWHYLSQVHKLLIHKSKPVKIFALQEISRATSDSDQLNKLSLESDLLISISDIVADSDLDTAQHAMNVIKKIGQCLVVVKMLGHPGTPLFNSFQKLIAQNDIIKFRAYEVVVDIAKISQIHLAECQRVFLPSLVELLMTDDILVQLNVLELLSELVVVQHGYEYLDQQQVLLKISKMIIEANENPLSALLITGLMKFFGNLARFNPQIILSKYTQVILALFEVLQCDDQATLSVALDTIGYIAFTIEGKFALCQLGNRMMPNAIKRIAEIIKKMPTNLRIHGLKSLKNILELPKSEHDNRILSLTKSWFDSLCEQPIEMILSLCKQPFADIRQASLELLVVIASQVWGQEYIAQQPGLVEFLLDRSAEAFKECKQVKFEVVKRLSETSNIFDAPTMQRFKQFVDQGPFYIDIVTEVAIEDAS